MSSTLVCTASQIFTASHQAIISATQQATHAITIATSYQSHS